MTPRKPPPSELRRRRHSSNLANSEHCARCGRAVISGYAEAEFSNLLEGEENISFLPKPIDIKTLAERVKQELQKAA